MNPNEAGEAIEQIMVRKDPGERPTGATTSQLAQALIAPLGSLGAFFSGDYNDLSNRPDLSAYLLLDGSRAMQDHFDMGNNSIENVVGIGGSGTAIQFDFPFPGNVYVNDTMYLDNGMEVSSNIKFSSGYGLQDPSGYDAIQVEERRLFDDSGSEVMDWSRDTPDADIKISSAITMNGGSGSDRTLHLYYLKDDPMNPASFIADLSSGYFNLASGVLQVNGASGANFGPGMPTTMTIVDGIVTAAS